MVFFHSFSCEYIIKSAQWHRLTAFTTNLRISFSWETLVMVIQNKQDFHRYDRLAGFQNDPVHYSMRVKTTCS